MIEKISKDEENVVSVKIEEGMSQEEIMKLVHQRVDVDLPVREQTSNVGSIVCCIF